MNLFYNMIKFMVDWFYSWVNFFDISIVLNDGFVIIDLYFKFMDKY